MYDDIHETICDSLYDGDIHVEEGDGDDDFNNGGEGDGVGNDGDHTR